MVDLNCDMGEGIGNDEAIMPFITSANIACGFHAGSGSVMRHTIELALKHDVKIGAHPSFHDKEYFGRREIFVKDDKLYALILAQLIKIDLIAKEKGALLHHVKPHGALYNMAAKDARMAKIIAQAVQDFAGNLTLYGLSGSCLISEAKKLGLKTCSEVFADRTYQDDGSLTPRSQPNALIANEEKSIVQVLKMVKEKTVTTVSGKTIPIDAETICIHGDNKNAVSFARRLHEELIVKINY